MDRPELDPLRVLEGVQPDLGVREATHATAGMDDKDAGTELLEDLQVRLADLQDRLWAENERAVLVVLQGMDTAGKSGTMGRVFPKVNPQGVRVAAFKAPTDAELDHDYLWRVHAVCPPRGTIGVFDRSHYEDVGVVRVNGWIDHDEVQRRYRQINDFERMLAENGTVIRKVWLDISPEQQQEELQERIDEPDKHWKFNPGDLEVRAQWHDYMAAYREAMAATSTEWAPWYRVPSDRRWVSGACVAQLLVDTLEEMDPQPPPSNPDYDDLDVPALDG